MKLAKDLKEGVYFVSKITCSFLSGFVTTGAAAVVRRVGQPVRFLAMSQVLLVFTELARLGRPSGAFVCRRERRMATRRAQLGGAVQTSPSEPELLATTALGSAAGALV